MKSILFIFLGTLSFGIGVIAMIIPGLPTTPFLLLSAAFYVRSSKKLYNWLINHKIFGEYIKSFREKKGMTAKQKASALISMWVMISLSVIIFEYHLYLKIFVLFLGLIGTIVILKYKLNRKSEELGEFIK